jgi:hypothetical protein
MHVSPLQAIMLALITTHLVPVWLSQAQFVAGAASRQDGGID